MTRTRKIQCLILLLIGSQWEPVQAKLTVSTDPETKLHGWKLVDGNMELELLQRLPDQTRAFFLARGFPTEIADKIGKACVLQTIVRHRGEAGQAQPISVKLKEWLLKYQGTTRKIKLKEMWDQEWSEGQIKSPSRIAFRWATFPSEQTFHPSGDYNWGMISFNLPPGTKFDLNVKWTEGDKLHSGWIMNLQCAEDR